MSAKDTILKAIRANARPIKTHQRPVLPEAHYIGDPFDTFAQSIIACGGKAVRVSSEAEMQSAIAEHYPDLGEQGVYSVCPEVLPSNRSWYAETPANELESPYLSVLRGTLGVLENAAVWVDKATLDIPAMAFWCEHLVLVIDHASLTPRMAEAYRTLHAAGQHDGYFIAGPSKTADIAQTLVMGAQGARTCLVLVKG